MTTGRLPAASMISAGRWSGWTADGIGAAFQRTNCVRPLRVAGGWTGWTSMRKGTQEMALQGVETATGWFTETRGGQTASTRRSRGWSQTVHSGCPRARPCCVSAPEHAHTPKRPESIPGYHNPNLTTPCSLPAQSNTLFLALPPLPLTTQCLLNALQRAHFLLPHPRPWPSPRPPP